MNRFNSITKPLMWFMALLLTAFVAGCGGGSSGIIGVGTAAPATVTSIAVTTSIGVTPATASIPVAGKQQFVATAKYSDSTTSDVTTTANWTSGNAGATVEPHTGLATGVTANATPVIITATYGGKTATAALTVTSATLVSIAVTPATASVLVNGPQQFTAIATYNDASTLNVTVASSWTSAAPGVATIVSTTGVATGVASGTSVISASFGGQTATAALTVTAVAAGPTAINLLSITTNNFVVLSNSSTTGITDTGSHSAAITGNIGLSPASAAAIGVFCSEMTGNIYGADVAYVGAGTGFTACFKGLSADNTTVANAVLDLGTAYTAASAPATPAAVDAAHLDLLAGTIPAGTIFTPGTYTWGSNVLITGDITLTGGASDVWIFQMSGNLDLASAGSVPAGVHVILSGGAVASNVFWQVGGGTGATLGTNSTFYGNILSQTQVVMQTGAVLHGRALAKTAVILDANPVGP